MATGTNKITLEVVTPTGRALTAEADEVTVPSAKGELGVLPAHVPLVATLRTGLLAYRTGGEMKRCAVGTGFVEVGPDRCNVITDHFMEREGVDPIVVRKELETVDRELESLSAKAELDPGALDARASLIARENWLAAQLELYGDPPPAIMRPDEIWGPVPPPNDDEIATSEDDSEASA